MEYSRLGHLNTLIHVYYTIFIIFAYTTFSEEGKTFNYIGTQ